MKIKFSVSNLYVIMNLNYFKKFDKVIFDTWKKFNNEDYIKYSNIIKNLKTDDNQSIIPKNLTSGQQIKKYEEKYNFNISNEIKKCQNSLSTTEINKRKEEIINSIPEKIQKKEKEEIKKLINDSSNTVFGTKNENNAIKQFEISKCCKVLEMQKCFYICAINNHITNNNKKISLGLVGKIDGLTQNNEVIEIKNRVKKHFKILRNYEKPQIMTYLWMNNSKKGYLVENLKTQKEDNLHIIDVNYEDNYYENEILPHLKRYINFFNDFMENEEWKLDILKGEEEKIYKIYTTQY